MTDASPRHRFTVAFATMFLAMMMTPCIAESTSQLAPLQSLPPPPPLAPAQPAPTASPSCQDVAGFHALDFWFGDWDVYAQGKLDGHDVVAPVLAGCAVTEDWADVDGSHGMSLFYYNSFIDRWTQVWVTELASRRGGLKEKVLVDRSAGSVRFQGLLPGAPGSSLVLDRTTLSDQPNRRVHQVIENSVDGGTTWRIAYDAIYVHHGSPPPE